MDNKFKTLFRESLKSSDTEETIDIYFTRPIGLVFALLWNKLGIHPNAITILSIFLGVGAGYMFYFPDLTHNIMGVCLLMLANFCDSTDGSSYGQENAFGARSRWLFGRLMVFQHLSCPLFALAVEPYALRPRQVGLMDLGFSCRVGVALPLATKFFGRLLQANTPAVFKRKERQRTRHIRPTTRNFRGPA